MRLHVLDSFQDRIGRRGLKRTALARSHGHLLIHFASYVRTFLNAPVTSIAKSNLLLTVQQRMPLSDVVDVGRGADHSMNKTTVGIDSNVGLHSKREKSADRLQFLLAAG